MLIKVGTSGYSYTAWKGKFYPLKCPSDQMLAYYADQFSVVEINGSFYRLPTASSLKTWMHQVPAHFQFAFKAPQTITHRAWTRGSSAQLRQFLSVTALLKKRLGPLLFQFPPFFKKKSPAPGNPARVDSSTTTHRLGVSASVVV